MSALASAIDEFAGEDLAGVDDARLATDLVELRELEDRLTAERLRRLEEFDRRNAFARDGALSAAAWLRHNTHVSPSAAREQVLLARRLRDLPLLRAALANGRVTQAHARAFAKLTDDCPADVLGRIESDLVDVAEQVDPIVFGRLVRRLRDQLQPEDAEDRELAQHGRRGVTLADTFDGMVALKGLLPAEEGAVVKTALDAMVQLDTESTPDEERREPAQVRADALVEICRQALDSGKLPVTGGQRPHVVATVGVETLERRTGTALLEWGGPITAEQALRLACDAVVSRILTKGSSQPIDVGRETSTIPPATRRALVHRDRHCRFPGCRRPPRWTEGHHIHHWAHGGPTDLDNLVLLCRRHHRAIHHDGFSVEHVGRGVFVFRRPDGSPLARDDPDPA